MIDCVSYPYSEIQKLQSRVEELQGRLREAYSERRTHAAPGHTTGSLTGTPPGALYPPERQVAAVEEVRKEAEEIGILAVAGSTQPLGHTYGMPMAFPASDLPVYTVPQHVSLT